MLSRFGIMGSRLVIDFFICDIYDRSYEDFMIIMNLVMLYMSFLIYFVYGKFVLFSIFC